MQVGYRIVGETDPKAASVPSVVFASSFAALCATPARTVMDTVKIVAQNERIGSTQALRQLTNAHGVLGLFRPAALASTFTWLWPVRVIGRRAPSSASCASRRLIACRIKAEMGAWNRPPATVVSSG